MQSNSKSFDLTGVSHTKVRIMTSLNGYGSRDVLGEGPDKLYVDGVLVFESYPPCMIVTTGYFSSDAGMVAGCVASTQVNSNAVSYTAATPQGMGNAALAASCPYFYSNSDYSSVGACVYNIDVTVEHSGDTLQLSFTSGIDQVVSNEGWGYGDISPDQ